MAMRMNKEEIALHSAEQPVPVPPKVRGNKNLAPPKGHKKWGGIQKGQKHDKEESIRKDFLWVYKKMGGREALLRWAEDPKSMNDEFFKQLKVIIGGPGGKGTTKDKKVVFVNDLDE